MAAPIRVRESSTECEFLDRWQGCRHSILPRPELLSFSGTETAEVPENIVIGAVADPVSERVADRLAIAGEAQM